MGAVVAMVAVAVVAVVVLVLVSWFFRQSPFALQHPATGLSERVYVAILNGLSKHIQGFACKTYIRLIHILCSSLLSLFGIQHA